MTAFDFVTVAISLLPGLGGACHWSPAMGMFRTRANVQ